MLQGQSAAGLDEAGVTVGDGDGDAGGHQRPAAAGGEQGVLPGHQVEPGVARTGVGRQRQVGIELHHMDFEHGRIVGTS